MSTCERPKTKIAPQGRGVTVTTRANFIAVIVQIAELTGWVAGGKIKAGVDRASTFTVRP
jgi:hypothetical protein